MSKTQDEQSTHTYASALARIEEIVAQVDDMDQDVDALGPLVEEAAALLKFCRERLDRTQLRVDAALEDLVQGDENSDEALI